MASTTVTTASGENGSGLLTLTASAVDTVTFDADLDAVDIICPASSPADLWYTLDGSTPTVGGKKCYYVPVGAVDQGRQPRSSSGTVVKLISSGAATYVVQTSV